MCVRPPGGGVRVGQGGRNGWAGKRVSAEILIFYLLRMNIFVIRISYLFWKCDSKYRPLFGMEIIWCLMRMPGY